MRAQGAMSDKQASIAPLSFSVKRQMIQNKQAYSVHFTVDGIRLFCLGKREKIIDPAKREVPA